LLICGLELGEALIALGDLGSEYFNEAGVLEGDLELEFVLLDVASLVDEDLFVALHELHESPVVEHHVKRVN
jgi:hypothetical protein